MKQKYQKIYPILYSVPCDNLTHLVVEQEHLMGIP